MYNLNYTPTTLGVQSLREIISGGTGTEKVEYHCTRARTLDFETLYGNRSLKNAQLLIQEFIL
jgi:hypothetical protein